MEISLGLYIASINRIIKTIPAKLTCLTRVFLCRLWYVFTGVATIAQAGQPIFTARKEVPAQGRGGF